MSERLQDATQQNPELELPDDVLAGMAARRELALAAAAHAEESATLLAPSDEERELRRALRAAQLAAVDPALLEGVGARREDRAGELRRRLLESGPPLIAPQPAGQKVMDVHGPTAEMWWARTDWSWNDPGIVPFWDAAAGLRFAGRLDDPLDVYMRRNLTATARFFLTADRVPPALLGTVLSAPQVNVFGELRGMTLADLWDFGDQWCKCWLNLRQSVFMRIPGLSFVVFGEWIPFGTASRPITLMDIDGDGVQTNFLPGPIAMPALSFGLAAGWDVQIDLELWFDIQLEGDNTVLIFGFSELFESNLIQTPQWLLAKP